MAVQLLTSIFRLFLLHLQHTDVPADTYQTLGAHLDQIGKAWLQSYVTE